MTFHKVKKSRNGSMTLLLVFVMFAILAMAAVAINKSYMDVARSDLKSNLDLATKTGAIALGSSQDLRTAFVTASSSFEKAAPLGARNNERMEIVSVNFGSTIKQDDGSFSFTEGARPFNTIKVTGRYPKVFNGSMLPFNVFGLNEPDLVESSTAVRTDNDICLVVDRSASMAWDLSNVPFQYPNGRSELANYFSPPDPTRSRWAALVRSVDRFQRLLKEKIPGEVRLGLTSYSSDFTFGLFTSRQAEIDVPIDDRMSETIDALKEIGKKPIIGDTNITAGLNLAAGSFNSPDARTLTGNRIMILFTDGLQSEGGNPVQAARQLNNRGFIVHVISFSGQANQGRSRSIANAGGGLHFHADDESGLDEAFKNIAKSLPGTLVE